LHKQPPATKPQPEIPRQDAKAAKIFTFAFHASDRLSGSGDVRPD